MPLPPEPMLLYVIVTSVVYGVLWRWWWTTFENDDVELSYSEDRLSYSDDRLRDAEESDRARNAEDAD